ncbi:rod shape-determining protein MreD [Candidatus Fervidibacteria bacterium JGI MDM2 SSWTFF-3-K9]
MKRWLAILVGLVLLLTIQTVALPIWLPFGFIPDLLLLTVVLVGFWKPGSSGMWLGLVLGLFQGWMHGTGWWAFALSRALAGVFASWMRNQWLWQSVPAAGFCAGVSTIVAETFLALSLALVERSLLPLALLLTVGGVEAVTNAILGLIVSWFRHPKEVTV